MRRSGAISRPLGFFLLMLGFGLRLDTTWQTLASTLLGAGVVTAAMGLVVLARDPLSPGSPPGDNASSARGGQTGGTDCVPRSA